jgi:hypothetical protein
MAGKHGNKKKDPPKDGVFQPSILQFLTPALGILSARATTEETNNPRKPDEIMTNSNSQQSDTGKKRPLDKEGEKVSPIGKAMRLDDDTNSHESPEPRTNSRSEVYEKVVEIMKGLAPIIDDKNAPTPNREAFNALYQIVIFLSHVVFEDFGTVDRVVNENREIRESNQTLKYAQHCDKLKKEMEKSQRTVKILDMPVEDSLIGGKIENTNTARENVKKVLKNKLNVSSDLLIGSSISINTKSIRDGNTPVGIIAADKDKKITIEKALRAASKKVVVEWPSYLYSHIKEIRKGYNKSNKFRNSQILIRPSASNNKLVISSRPTSNDRWEYIETLSFPLNPSDIEKFGQKRQPCKSILEDVLFNFLDTKEYYKNIPSSNIDPLSNSFQPAKNGVPAVQQPGTPRATTPTRNRFDGLGESQA